MDAMCRTRDLERALRITQHGIGGTQKNETRNDRRTIVATGDAELIATCWDEWIEITTTLPATVRQPGQTAAPQIMLSRLVGAMQGPTIRLAAGDNIFTVESGGAKARLRTTAADTRPKRNRAKAAWIARLNHQRLRRALRAVGWGGVPHDDVARMSGNARMDYWEGGARLVSNAGFKATTIDLQMEAGGCGEGTLMLPLRSLLRMEAALHDETADITLEVRGDRGDLSGAGERTTVRARAANSDRTLPNPETDTNQPITTAVVEARQLKLVMQGADAMARDTGGLSELHFTKGREGEGELRVVTADATIGEIAQRVPLRSMNGPDTEVTVDTTLLKSSTREQVGENVTILLRGAKGLITITEKDATDRMTQVMAPCQ